MKIDVTASMQEFTDTINPLSTNPTKWSNTPTIRRQMPTNCLSVFDHFVRLALKGLMLVSSCPRFMHQSLKL